MIRADPAAEIGAGFLARTTAVVYWLLVVELLLVLTIAPGLVAALFLARDASNAPLAALLLVPVGPALAAALFAWRVFLGRIGDGRDLAPARHFWRGYRHNALDVLRWWVPTLAVLTVLAVGLANIDRIAAPAGYAAALGVVAVAVLGWAGHALVLSSALTLRTRDTARLAAYYLSARPLATLGVLGLVVVAVALVVLLGDWAPLALASPLTFLLLRTTEPVLADAVERFTA